MEAKRKAAYFATQRGAAGGSGVSARSAAPAAAAAPQAAAAAAAASSEGSKDEGDGADGSAAAAAAAEDDVAVAGHMQPDEVKRRLRQLGEVVTFFGEGDDSREARLRKIQTTLGDEGTEGRINLVQQILKQQEEAGSNLLESAGSLLTEEEEKAKKEKDAAKMPAPILNRKMSSEQSILAFIQRLIKEYSEEMERRAADQKKTAQGKQDYAYMMEASINIEPLLELLEKHQLEPDIVAHLEVIVQCMLMRDYVKAMEQYVLLTIGNAPWPMGVTSVGIHERAGREKIFEQKTAHILNDEQKRKYIHAFKRLMMFCQAQYPTDPSRTYDPGAVKNTTIFTEKKVQSGLSELRPDNVITSHATEGTYAQFNSIQFNSQLQASKQWLHVCGAVLCCAR
jgi:pre-mRNA-splicing factor 18